MVHRLLCVAIVATLQVATVGGGLAQWSTAELSAWLADELELPNVAAEVARAGIDGDRAQSMEKSDWRSVGATGLQAAKLRARVVKAAQDDSNPPPVAAGRPPAGPKFAVDEIVDVETEDGVERGVRILGAATSGSPDELRVQFADGTVDDWSVEDMAPAVKSLKTRRAKGAARRQQKRRVAGMSATELAAAGVQAFRAQQYEEALEIFEHAQQVVDPKADPQTALNVNNYLGAVLRGLGRPSEAIPLFMNVVAMAPDFVEAHHHICAAKYEEYTNTRDRDTNVLADTAEERAALESALKHCDDALAAGDPHGEESQHAGRTNAFQSKGIILQQLSRFRESRLAMDAALHLRSIGGQHISLYHALRQFEDATVLDCDTTFHKVWSEEDEEGQRQSTPLDQQQLLFGLAGFPTSLRPWHTPVWLARLANGGVTKQLNLRLAQGILGLMSQDPGVVLSNVGGWQSRKQMNFLQAGAARQDAHGAAVRSLHTHILQQVSNLLRQLGLPDGDIETSAGGNGKVPFVSIPESWANVHLPGSWNAVHSHGTAVWAGCYYITSGYGEDDATGGVTTSQRRTSLRLRDPRVPHVELPPFEEAGPWGWPMPDSSYSTERLAENEWSHEALGAAGTLALWPASVRHWVPEHRGSMKRISIAFNVQVSYEGSQ